MQSFIHTFFSFSKHVGQKFFLHFFFAKYFFYSTRHVFVFYQAIIVHIRISKRNNIRINLFGQSNNLFNRIRFYIVITIKKTNILTCRMLYSCVSRHTKSGIHFMNYSYPRIFFSPLITDLRAMVWRSIVN